MKMISSSFGTNLTPGGLKGEVTLSTAGEGGEEDEGMLWTCFGDGGFVCGSGEDISLHFFL